MLVTHSMAASMYIRDPLTEEMTPRRFQLPRSATHEHFSFPREYSPLKSDRLCPPLRSDRTPARNRPHSLHVKPVFGVSGSMVCSVQEKPFPPRPLSPLSERDLTCQLAPVFNTRYSANLAKSEPAVGITPVTYEWKTKFPAVVHDVIKAPAEESDVPEKQEARTLPDKPNDNRVHDMLLDILNRAGGKGIRQEKLPNLFSYLARTSRDPSSKAKKSLYINNIGKKTTFEHPHSKAPVGIKFPGVNESNPH